MCGSEVYISQNIVSLIKDKKASTLANSKYLLFELPMNYPVTYMEEIIFEIQANGMIPVLAHPERYAFVQKNPNMIYDWIQKGVLMQSNFACISGYYGTSAKNTLKKLLKANMIHFLASDAHRQDKYVKIEENLKELEKWISKEKIIKLTKTNPKHILEDKELTIEEPSKIKKSLFH